MSTVDLPNVREPFIDQRTGQISRAWWIWLQQLMTRIGGSSGSDLAAIRQSIIDLIAATNAQDLELNGFAVPPPFPTDVGMPPDVAPVPLVPSVFGRTGEITAQTGDYTVGQVTNAASVLATLAQFAATTSAQLAGVLSDETGTGAAVFGTSPTLNQANLVGTTTNDNAAAGSVGEYVTGSTTGTALTTATNADVASISLTAGDWDVSGLVLYIPAGATTVSALAEGPSSTSATFGGLGALTSAGLAFTTGAAQRRATAKVRFSLAATTTIYLVAQATFGVSTMTADGFLRARRIR